MPPTSNAIKMHQNGQRLNISRWRWLWLAIGAILLPFTAFQTVMPIAAWLAPVFILRFARTSRRGLTSLPLVVLAYTTAYLVAFRHGFVPFEFLVMFVPAAE